MQSSPPVAKYLAVARIAFPNCTDRSIYNASMDGLESWFQEADRIVCEGDIFSISIDGKCYFSVLLKINLIHLLNLII
jgi:hypothetical protein